MVTVPLPHLAGLAAAVRVALDERVPTMGVFASGRLVANPAVHRAAQRQRARVRAGARAAASGAAHARPRQGLGPARVQLRARLHHQRHAARRARRADDSGRRPRHAGRAREVGRGDRARDAPQRRLHLVAHAGLGRRGHDRRRRARPARQRRRAPDDDSGDVLDARRERELFPDDAADQARRAEGDAASSPPRGLALGKAMGAMQGPRRRRRRRRSRSSTALRGIYRTPWQMALQTWLEGVAPGERTFARPSRRGADRHDVVMPGRKRYAWMLNVVLDTSGSMTDEIPRALGAIADFCDAAGVDEIRLVQCDTAVTSDEVLTPDALAALRGQRLRRQRPDAGDAGARRRSARHRRDRHHRRRHHLSGRADALCRAVGAAAARPAGVRSRPTGASSRCSKENADEGRAGARHLFRPARQAVAEAAPQAAGAGLPRRRRAGARCSICATPSARPTTSA